MVYSQLYLLRGPSNSDQHRKHCDSPCCPGDVIVPYVISFFSLSSLNSLSCVQKTSLLSRLSTCDRLQGNLYLQHRIKKDNGVTQQLTAMLTHEGYKCISTHACSLTWKNHTYTSTPAFTNANTQTQRSTHSHTFCWCLSIIQNSCCAKNELTVPVLAVALNIDFLKKY